MHCKKCGDEACSIDAFCSNCGAKLKETCSYCWVKKRFNYSCGEPRCPGYELFTLEKRKSDPSERRDAMEERIAELEERIDRLEKAFKIYLDEEEKSLAFLRKIINRLQKMIEPWCKS